MTRVHDPMNRNCARNNTTCLAYHSDGVCPDKGNIGTCTCSRQGECKECGGSGVIATHGFHNPETGECTNCPIQEECEACKATGFVQEKQDWDGKLEVNQTPQWIYEFNKFLVEERSTGEIIEFIRKEKELSKEEGRREGYEDGKALRGKEWKQDIEEVRLEVINAVEDYVRRYYVLHENDGKPLIEKADILALLDSIKTNSK